MQQTFTRGWIELALVRMLVAAAPVLAQDTGVIPLPIPAVDGGAPLTRTLAERHSVRAFAGTAVRLEEVGQLLWAAQGVTKSMPAPEGWRESWGEWRGGTRTAPSAGALYPLELYLVVAAVDGLEPGLYRYLPGEHALVLVGSCGRGDLAAAALNQRAIAEAPVVFVLTAVHARTAQKYGERAPRYVHMEVGAAAENLLLQATALELGGVFIGAFRDDPVRQVLGVPEEHAPLALLPVGHPGAS